MGQQVKRAGQIQPHGGLQRRRHVALVIGEMRHVTDVWVVGHPVGKALSAPVDRQRRKAARGQIGGGGAVFLDILGAPGKQQHGPVGRCLGAPVADADSHPVGTAQPPGRAARRAAGHVIIERGRRSGHQARTEASFIARPMSPSTESLPVMKALVGLTSPETIPSKVS